MSIFKNARAFSALQPGITFRTDGEMQLVVRDYFQDDLRDWRINHLPLTVGQASSHFLRKIDHIAGHKNNIIPISVSLDGFNGALPVPSAEECASRITASLQGQDIPYLPKLAAIGGEIASAIIEQDKRWFGKSIYRDVNLDHEVIGNKRGAHMGDTGVLHRDFSYEPAELQDRIYVFRSRFVSNHYANNLTEGVATRNLSEAVRDLEPKRLPDGSIVLINGGAAGTVNQKYCPKPHEDEKPSLMVHVRMLARKNFG